MNSGEISVIIPVYNTERYLAEAIASVLAQRAPAAEIIVIDDGSTDRSGDVVRTFGKAVRYVAQAHAGIAAARNRGVNEARFPLLAFLDADDLWLPEKLALQLKAFASTPGLQIAFGAVEQFISPELSAEERSRFVCPPESMTAPHCGTMLCRCEVFEQNGVFETDLRAGEFLSWYLRARELGIPMQVLDTTVMRRRIHLTNTMRQNQGVEDLALLLKRSLDRRRAGGTLT